VTYTTSSVRFSQAASASVFLPTVWLLRDSGPTYLCTENFTPRIAESANKHITR